MRLLLVRLREIGDVVFTTPAVRALRERFPDGHVTYIVEPAAAPVVAGNPHIDDLIVAPRRRGLLGLLADISLGRRLRRAGVDLAIDFHGGPRASLLVALSGAPTRVGYAVTGRGWIYTHRVDRPRALRARHSVENQWDLLTAIGVPPPDPVRYPVEMPLDPAVVAGVASRLTASGVGPSDRLVVMHVSAGNPFRRWPIESFAEVAARLAVTGQVVVVTSGPSDRDAAARVIGQARHQLGDEMRGRIPDAGDFTLPELRALVERAALYIGGDSGPLHIAATSRVPIVGLYGPTLPARSAPWRPHVIPAESVETAGLPCRPCDQRRCEPGDFRCLTRITPADVVAAAERALAGASR
jgi:lipopolysaccharide heptosyltransferase II